MPITKIRTEQPPSDPQLCHEPLLVWSPCTDLGKLIGTDQIPGRERVSLVLMLRAIVHVRELAVSQLVRQNIPLGAMPKPGVQHDDAPSGKPKPVRPL